MPFLSLIITVYNLPSQYVAECLDSLSPLLAQGRIEVIIVDDGSDTPVDDVAKQHCPQAIVIRKENGGLSSARNEGLLHAHGEYIQFIDGDDLLLPAYLQVVDVAQTTDADIIMFKLTRHRERAIVGEGSMQPITMPCQQFLQSHNLRASACGYMFRREMLGGLRFTSRLLHEDEEFTPRLFLKATTIASLPIKAYFYRQRQHSITTSESLAHQKRRYANTLYIVSRLTEEPLVRRQRQLASDLLFNVLKQRPSMLPYITKRLKAMALYPLPWANYSLFYRAMAVFSRLYR